MIHNSIAAAFTVIFMEDLTKLSGTIMQRFNYFIFKIFMFL